ncbi:MAG: hypothetical protein PHI35_09485 [Victivallaceae bacterium]|nr:hypothetical protein [Victivallaceae bacterium]
MPEEVLPDASGVTTAEELLRRFTGGDSQSEPKEVILNAASNPEVAECLRRLSRHHTIKNRHKSRYQRTPDALPKLPPGFAGVLF